MDIIHACLSPSHHLVRLYPQLQIHQIQKPFHIPQQLLTDALARAVDAELDARRAEEDGRREEAHGDGLAEAARGRDEDLLRQVLPPVDLEQPLVVALEDAWWFRLVEYARARPDELLVELPLVVAAIPALAVQRLQRAPAFLDPVKRAHASARGSALHKLFHCAQGLLRRRGPVGRFVGVVEGLER